MQQPDERIIEFINTRHVVSIAVEDAEYPWAFNCFYALDQDSMSLIFLTSENTHHGTLFTHQHHVAGTIATAAFEFSQIKGIQFVGNVRMLSSNESDVAKGRYLERIPAAEPMIGATPLWKLDRESIKYTDNSIGFGSKIHWSRVPTSLKKEST